MSRELSYLFSSLVELDDESHFIKLPSQESPSFDIDTDTTYRVLFLPKSPGETNTTPSHAPDAPVAIDATLEVLIEDIGSEGDGIARIGPGYIIFIPKTDIGHKVKIKINSVTSRCAFGEVVEHLM